MSVIRNDPSKKVLGADTINNRSNSVNLYTESGEFVANVPVLPFMSPPQILVWGSRFFRLVRYDGEPAGAFKYRETFAYVFPPPELDYSLGSRYAETAPGAMEAPSLRTSGVETEAAYYLGGKPSKQDEIEKEINNPTVCPECGLASGLHKRTCSVYRKEIDGLSKGSFADHGQDPQRQGDGF